MFVVPAVPAVTTPFVTPIVATPGDPELHVPPLRVLFNVVVLPWQSTVFPVITVGMGLTVKGIVMTQPVPVV